MPRQRRTSASSKTRATPTGSNTRATRANLAPRICSNLLVNKARLSSLCCPSFFQFRNKNAQIKFSFSFLSLSTPEHVDSIHLKRKNLSCDQCNFKTSKRKSLTSHMQEVHIRDRRFACTFCEFKSARKAGLEKHIQARTLRQRKSSKMSHFLN